MLGDDALFRWQPYLLYDFRVGYGNSKMYVWIEYVAAWIRGVLCKKFALSKILVLNFIISSPGWDSQRSFPTLYTSWSQVDHIIPIKSLPHLTQGGVIEA